jgi:acyl-coenzyme A thioesterase PaaI-like protein
MRAGEDMLRPGGTVSGPAMFTLADVGIYIAILGVHGATALEAVTSNLAISFLSRPAPCDLIARVRLLKSGSRLCFGEVALYSDGKPEMVAHATATYVMPPSAAVR